LPVETLDRDSEDVSEAKALAHGAFSLTKKDPGNGPDSGVELLGKVSSGELGIES